MKTVALSALMLALSLSATGQKTKPTPVPVTSGLTETQQLRMENLQLRLSLDQQQERMLQQDMQQRSEDLQTLVNQIEAAHPGHRYDMRSGQLVALPAAPSKK